MTSVSVSTKKPVSTVTRPNIVAVGTIVWLSSELLFFAGLFAIYFSLRAVNPELWAIKTEMLNVPFAAINTSILVLSSFTAQFGVFAAEKLRPRRTSWNPVDWGMVEWFFLSYLLGGTFVAGQVWEYATMVSEGITINSDPYAAAFYLTTGFHGIHVTAGLVAFLFIIGRAYSAKRFGHYEATSAVVVSYYWHFVDVVWLVLFGVIYLLPN